MSPSSNIATAMDIDEAAIDEGLYSRQLYVLYIPRISPCGADALVS